MLIGYTLLDPLIVLLGTALAAWLLSKNPIRLMGYMPAALSLYFFLPFVTLLTLWQTVPLLLTGRLFLRGTIAISSAARPILAFMFIAFVASASYALVSGSDGTRVAIRILYYLGLLGLFSFSYEMGRRPECFEIFLRGLVITGAILALYGLYQIAAAYLGLPLRAIVYGTNGTAIAYEAGIMRINSFANEPKRLGYVLFVCGLACFFLQKIEPQKAKLLRQVGCGILAVSLFTFAGSYYLAIVMFAVAVLVLYPGRTMIYLTLALTAFGLLPVAFPESGFFEALRHGYERRSDEVEVGLDGTHVYRQEFFAWDYLANYPGVVVSGVGLGQYYVTLSQEYGAGVGINEHGGLLPLNSTFLETLFDLGGFASSLLYMSFGVLILKLRRAGETFLCLSLLFLTLQSLTILTMQFIVLFAGISSARCLRSNRHNQIDVRSTKRGTRQIEGSHS